VGPPPGYGQPPTGQPPVGPPPGYGQPPAGQPPYNRAPVSPFNQQYNPSAPLPPDAYHPDLTMDMGSSLGYGQSIQFHSISMPQPTQSLPRLRQERLQQLRQQRIHRDQRQKGPDITALIVQKGQEQRAGLRPGGPSGPLAAPEKSHSGPYPVPPYMPPSGRQAAPGTNSGLQPAIQPAQNTTALQRVKVARASSLIGAAFMGSSILGLLQTFLFTYIFGPSIPGEAYLLAYIIPNLIYTVIAGGALSSAFIPVFTQYAVKNNDERTAWHIASSALNISVVLMIVISIIATFLAPVLVPLYSRPNEVALVVTLTRIMLLQAIVLGSGVIVGAVLNTKQDFTHTALGAVMYNVGLILGLVPGFFMTFHTRSSSPSEAAAYAATWGVVLGAILQVGVQIPGLFKVKMRYTFAFDWRHPGVRQIGRQMVPRIINAVMLSFSTTVDRALLSLLSTGLINSYTQAFSILILPVSLFGSSVSTAAFPTLADYAVRGRFERVRAIIMETLRGILFLTIPSAVGLAVLAFPITQALLEHGNFDFKATQLASVVLFFFALGLPGLAAVEILTRSFYALQDSKTPVTISVIQFILKIALSVVLINLATFGIEWGMGVLALSTSIAGTFEAFVLFHLLARRIGGFELRDFTHFVVYALLASGAMAITVFLLRIPLDHMLDTTSMQKLYIPGILMALTKVIIELGAGTAVFLVTARLLKMEEMNSGLVRRVINLLRIPWL
jgi:putative peptidoglycan lipid II flippase